MSKTQGQQTLSLQKAYRAAGHPEKINHAQSALKHRKLGHDHISGVVEALHAKIEAAPVKLWLDSQETGNDGQNVKLNNRSARISMAFMDAPDPANPHLFVPTVSKFSVNPLHLFGFERRLPLIISSRHVEDKHSLSTKKLPVYSDAPFLFMAGFSIILADSLADKLEKKGFYAAPAIIPHPEGLFLGHTCQTTPEAYAHKRNILEGRIRDVCMETRGNQRGSKIQIDHFDLRVQSYEHEFEMIRNAEIWSPRAETHILTFVGKKDLRDDLYVLFHYFSEMMESQDMPSVMRFAMEAYAIGSSDRATRLTELANLAQGEEMRAKLQKYDEMKKITLEIMETDDWKKAVAKSWKHVPDAPASAPLPAPASADYAA